MHDEDLVKRFDKFLKASEPTSANKFYEEANKPSDLKSKFKEIPDFLICRISDDLMEDPVVIESGFTYERKAIL